jgi:hypothetical protein
MNKEMAMVGTLSRLITAALLCLLPLDALAQTPAAAPSQALLKPAELDQLVAPIAPAPFGGPDRIDLSTRGGAG